MVAVLLLLLRAAPLPLLPIVPVPVFVAVRPVLVHGATASAADDDIVVIVEVGKLVAARPGPAVTILGGCGSGRVDGLAELGVGVVDRVVGVFRALDRGAVSEVVIWKGVRFREDGRERSGRGWCFCLLARKRGLQVEGNKTR